MAMAEKVNLRFEQFDANADGDILASGPVVIDGTFDLLTDVTGINRQKVKIGEPLVYRGMSGSSLPTSSLAGSHFLLISQSSYSLKFSESDNLFINQPSIEDYAVFYSTNEDKYYELRNGSWSEKAVQDVIVYVRNVLDEVSPGVVQDLKFRGAYFYYRELTDSWQEIMLGTHTHENKAFLDKLDSVDVSGQVGSKKFFTLEITDTDESGATYEYNINWEDLPEPIPVVPESDLGKNLYLGLDSEGKAEWKNNLLAAQAFQVKSRKVEATGLTISFDGVEFNQSLDEVLVLVGKFFVYNIERPIQYSQLTKTLTIKLISDPDSSEEVQSLEVGETVTIIVIRNGAAAILDTLATDYVTKDEAITLLSGGSVNLSDYATKADLRGYAKKYHTHSQFARADHEHDYRYAMFNHTHAEYLTRKTALELIQQTLIGTGGDSVISTLTAISDYLNNNSEVLATLATKAELADIQSQIDAINASLDINDEGSTFRVQLDSYLNNRTFDSHQINTGLLDEGGINKNLNQVLTEIREDIDADLGKTDTKEVILDEDIPVLLSSGENQGDYTTGNTAERGQTMKQILFRLLQREIVPSYVVGVLSASFSAEPQNPEVGEEVELLVSPTFVRNDSGLLNSFSIVKQVDGVVEVLHTSASLSAVTANVQALEQETEIIVSASYLAGEPKFTNIDAFYGRTTPDREVPGKIQAGSTNTISYSLSGKRAVFFGASSATPEISGSSIRALFERDLPQSLSSFDYEYSVPAGSRFILFAMPQSSGQLSRIVYLEQSGLDIKELFSEQTVAVPGANGFSPAFYTVYSLSLPNATSGQMTLNFRK
jgi:hypothetical protein